MPWHNPLGVSGNEHFLARLYQINIKDYFMNLSQYFNSTIIPCRDCEKDKDSIYSYYF